MGKRPYDDARAKANKKYDSKTYKQMTVRLRLDEDAELIEAMRKNTENGGTFREWLWDLYNNKK